MLRIETALIASTGFMLGLYPEAAIGFACACALWGIWSHGLRWNVGRDLLIMAFCAVRLVYVVRIHGTVWIPLLECVVTLLLPRASWILGRLFAVFAVAGLCASVVMASYSAWNPSHAWTFDRTRVEQVAPNRYHPISRDYAWVVQSQGVQGPGEITYSLEVGASRTHALDLLLLHPGLPKGRLDSKCAVSPRWNTCRISSKLKRGGALNVWIGGLWSKNDPWIEVRKSTLRTSSPSSFVDRLRFTDRQAGWSFNENAFGAWIVLVGLLAVRVSPSLWVRALALIAMAVGAYLSGSRGALLAGAVGLLAMIRSWLVVPIIVLAFALQAQTPIRALNVNDFDTAQSRLELWQTALKAALAQPVFGPTDPVYPAPPFGFEVRRWSHAHNIWIQMLVEGGLLQLALLCGLLFFALLRSRHWIAPLVAILFINATDFLFYYAPVRLTFGLLLGVLASRADADASTLHDKD